MFLLSLISFLVMVTLLVAIHEAGHFFMARAFGVGVKEFAVGFGKKLFSRQSNNGTLYSLRVLPLGGFLALKDNKLDGLIAATANKTQQPEAAANVNLSNTSTPVSGYDMQDVSKLQQTLIYLGGPLANIVLGIIILMIVALTLGVPAPMLTYVEPDSQAYQNGVKAGDLLIGVDDADIYSQRVWQNIALEGNQSALKLKFHAKLDNHFAVEGTDDYSVDFFLPESSRQSNAMNIARLEEQLGFSTAPQYLPPVFAEILPASAAEKSGLQPGDQVLSVEGTQIATAKQWADAIRIKAGVPVNITVKKFDGSVTSVVITPNAVTDQLGDTIGQAGTLLDTSAQLLSLPLSKSLSYAVSTVWQGLIYTTAALTKLVTGRGSSEDYVGVVGIAHISGQAVVHGLYSTLLFMALLSVSVGIFNLLPLPLLDGGHIVRLGVEFVLRRSLGIRGLIIYQSIGLLMILVIFTLTLYFDINKLI